MGRGRKPSVVVVPTVGGTRLRLLRERAGLTLLELMSRTDDLVAATHIQRIEVGKIRQPDCETLQMILRALNARYSERRDVIEGFGYRMAMELPTAEEIVAAKASCAHELEEAAWPVYLIDCAQRLLAWNRFVPKLIGLDPDDPSLNRFHNCTIFDLALNPAYTTRLYIDNPAEFLPAMVALTKHELKPFVQELWYLDLVDRCRKIPGFTELWDQVVADQGSVIGSRIPVPLRLDVPGVGVLDFVLTRSPLVGDPRFQIVAYAPLGVATLRQCSIWNETE